MQSRLWLTSGLVAMTLVSAACGGSSPSSSASSPTPSQAPSPTSTGTTIAAATNAKLGQILVDGKGITVYVFVPDTTIASTCYGSCAAIWPPVLTVDRPQAGTGADPSKLGTTTRTDGKLEVTYASHPLYYFLQDKNPGDVTGQGVNGFGGPWYVMSPAGLGITTKVS